MTRFFDKRFIIISGKGGTGKSTLSGAIALAAARAGRRVLVAELNVREKVPQLFGKPPSGYAPQRLHEGIESMNVLPEECLREYGLMKLRFRSVYRLVFENDLMRRLTGTLPGMNELLMLGKLMFLETELEARGKRPRWDLIVVDAPATGHGVALFRLPQVILEAVSAGPLATDARRIRELLLDERRTSFNIVTLPEEMPIVEAAELRTTLRSVLGIPPGFLFVNAVWPEVLSDHEQRLLQTFWDSRRGSSPGLAPLVRAVCASVGVREHQVPHLARARQLIDLPTIEIPYVFTPSFGLEALDTISQHVKGAIDRHESAPWAATSAARRPAGRPAAEHG